MEEEDEKISKSIIIPLIIIIGSNIANSKVFYY